MKDLLRFCTSGEVDSGKSMMLGRLLYETGCIYDDQLEAVINSSKKRNKESIDLSLLLDGLESERDQGITIDVAYRYFETDKRRFIVADTPGHEQYTRNMVTGASNSQLAIILIDAQHGVQTQSKRHGIINSLLNIPHLIVAVNKMDLVDYSQDVFNTIVEEYTQFSEKLNIQDITFIPISALNGDNVCNNSINTPWYNGETVLYKLENVHVSSSKNTVDFRFPVQNVIRPNHTFRGYCGKVISGSIRPGEEVQILPSGLKTKIMNISHYKETKKEAKTGESVVITLTNEIDIDRGNMIVREGNKPYVSSNFVSMLCWMSETPLQQKSYILKHTSNKVNAFVNVLLKIDVNTLHRKDSSSIELNDLFKAEIETTKPVLFDEYNKNRENGSFILIDPDTNNTVAAGMIEKSIKPKETIKYLSGGVTADYTGEKGKVLWFTGLSGSGKSTIASGLSKELQNRGYQVVILDGDNIRKGLCSDLGFSLEDRKENIRRISEVAKLFSEAGITVITSFISPTIEDRKNARNIIGDRFTEVYVECSLEVCEKRDVKGLYKKARLGEINNFTGIGSPYEAPNNPELIVNTENTNLERCIKDIISYFL